MARIINGPENDREAVLRPPLDVPLRGRLAGSGAGDGALDRRARVERPVHEALERVVDQRLDLRRDQIAAFSWYGARPIAAGSDAAL